MGIDMIVGRNYLNVKTVRTVLYNLPETDIFFPFGGSGESVEEISVRRALVLFRMYILYRIADHLRNGCYYKRHPPTGKEYWAGKDRAHTLLDDIRCVKLLVDEIASCLEEEDLPIVQNAFSGRIPEFGCNIWYETEDCNLVDYNGKCLPVDDWLWKHHGVDPNYEPTVVCVENGIDVDTGNAYVNPKTYMTYYTHTQEVVYGNEPCIHFS